MDVVFLDAPGVEPVDDLAPVHQQDAVAVLDEFGHVVGNHQHGEAGAGGQLADAPVDLGLGADIDADGGAVENQDPWGR